MLIRSVTASPSTASVSHLIHLSKGDDVADGNYDVAMVYYLWLVRMVGSYWTTICDVEGVDWIAIIDVH